MAERRQITPPLEKKLCQQLSPTATAWAIGVNPRALRDAGLDQNVDGSYDVRNAIQWAIDRRRPGRMSDADYEIILQVIDVIEDRCVLHLEPLLMKHGNDVAVHFLEALLSLVHDCYDDAPPEPTIEEEVERYRKSLEEQRARWNFEITTVICDHCNKARNGRRWTTTEVPVGHATKAGLCPDCVKKYYSQSRR